MGLGKYLYSLRTYLLMMIYRHPYAFYLLLALLVFCVYLILPSDIEHRDARGRTALYLAAEQGQLIKVEALLAQGSQVDALDDCRWTPFMRAAQNGHISVVKHLLGAGANINAVDKEGYDALIASAITYQIDVMRYLLEQGIDRNVQDSTMGWTAMIWAAKEGRLDMVQLLIDQGADTGHRDGSGKTAYDWAVEKHHDEIAQLLEY